jgi:hypothetical protein
MKKLINLDDLGAGAPLKEVTSVTNSNKGKIPTKAKNIQNMPLEFFTRHAALREQGHTSLLFTPYIIEAVRKALEKDEQS